MSFIDVDVDLHYRYNFSVGIFQDLSTLTYTWRFPNKIDMKGTFANRRTGLWCKGEKAQQMQISNVNLKKKTNYNYLYSFNKARIIILLEVNCRGLVQYSKVLCWFIKAVDVIQTLWGMFLYPILLNFYNLKVHYCFHM